MVFMNNVSDKILHYSFVEYETNDLYRIGVHTLKDKFILYRVTCDGRRDLLGSFGNMVHTNVPLSSNCHCSALFNQKPQDEWHDQHKDYLNERTANDDRI